MKKIRQIILLFILVLLFSCEDQGLIIYCPDCFETEPVKAEIEAKLENNKYYPDVLIQIWEGNLEDSILVDSYSYGSYLETFRHEVTINKKYTFTATYNILSTRYVAVDSATPRVKFDKQQCNNPCFFVYDRKVDLRLKFAK